MRLPKKKSKIVLDVVDSLEATKEISPEVAAMMRSRIEPIAFDWRRLARYSFVAALVCVVIAVVATFADQYVLELLTRFENFIRQFLRMPIIIRSIGVAVASGLLVWWGLRRRARSPRNIYSNEAVFAIAAMGFGWSIYLLGESINRVDAWIIFAATAALYFALGFIIESKLIWTFGILAISNALGTDVAYDWGSYCLGMEHPIRTLVLGAVLFGGAELARLVVIPGSAYLQSRVALLGGVTRVFGLLHVFISLWILSLWGSDWHYRLNDSHWDLVGWSLAFGAVAVGCVVWALFKDDAVLRGFGLTFFFIELYTKFFEYFWDGLHKAVFFAILGVSFWLIGRKAEAIWNMKLAR